MSTAGKGSKQRPLNKKIFDENFDNISKKEIIDNSFKTVKINGKYIQRKVYK
jgi:hypothetical protein